VPAVCTYSTVSSYLHDYKISAISLTYYDIIILTNHSDRVFVKGNVKIIIIVVESYDFMY
jgi:hypothetical protein